MVEAGLGRLAVVYGGDSPERDISLQSGRALCAALAECPGIELLDMQAQRVDAGLTGRLLEARAEHVLIALHGGGGEDGTLQGLLDAAGIRYSGSDAASSRLAMDKNASKVAFRAAGLPTPDWVMLGQGSDWEHEVRSLGAVMVKPCCAGSSLGAAMADDAAGLCEAYKRAAQFDERVMAERLVSGGEYSVAVLGGRALPAVALNPGGDFYDYNAKYRAADTGYSCPAPLADERAAGLGRLALDAFAALGCSGWGRVDIMEDGDGWQILEVNTVPGMTERSLVPMAAAAAGISYGQLALAVASTAMRTAPASVSGGVA